MTVKPRFHALPFWAICCVVIVYSAGCATDSVQLGDPTVTADAGTADAASLPDTSQPADAGAVSDLHPIADAGSEDAGKSAEPSL